MKKTLLAAVVLASFGMVSTAMAATQTFTWNGGVPAFEAGKDYKIVSVGLTDFDSGVLDFTNDGTDITLSRSDAMQFVVMQGAEGAETQVAYNMELKGMRVNGVEEVNSPNFQVMNGLVKLDTNKTVAVGADATTNLTIGSVDAKMVGLESGDRVQIQAVLTIAPAA